MYLSFYLKIKIIKIQEYTQEHLEDLSEALRIAFGDNWSLSTKKISAILNQIYNVSKTETRIATLKNYTFYKNILPSGVSNKNRTFRHKKGTCGNKLQYEFRKFYS